MVTIAHDAWTLLERTGAKIHSAIRLVWDAFADAREARARLEADLFRSRYRMSSKNDDDFPLVH